MGVKKRGKWGVRLDSGKTIAVSPANLILFCKIIDSRKQCRDKIRSRLCSDCLRKTRGGGNPPSDCPKRKQCSIEELTRIRGGTIYNDIEKQLVNFKGRHCTTPINAISGSKYGFDQADKIYATIAEKVKWDNIDIAKLRPLVRYMLQSEFRDFSKKYPEIYTKMADGQDLAKNFAATQCKRPTALAPQKKDTRPVNNNDKVGDTISVKQPDGTRGPFGALEWREAVIREISKSTDDNEQVDAVTVFYFQMWDRRQARVPVDKTAVHYYTRSTSRKPIDHGYDGFIDQSVAGRDNRCPIWQWRAYTPACNPSSGATAKKPWFGYRRLACDNLSTDSIPMGCCAILFMLLLFVVYLVVRRFRSRRPKRTGGDLLGRWEADSSQVVSNHL